jgi:hypothetical protein
MVRIFLISVFIIIGQISSAGQAKMSFLSPSQDRFEVPFEVSQNLIIIPAKINGSQTMKFILDSGITKTIITEMTGVDTVPLNLVRDIKIEGLGEGDAITAWKSSDNRMIIESRYKSGEGLASRNMDVFVIPDNNLEFSRQFGLQINGLIGSDFFKNFVVEIDYTRKTVTFHRRDNYNFRRKTRRHSMVPLTIFQDRPYINVRVTQFDDSQINAKLLIDTGASMAMWLSVFSNDSIKLPEITYPAMLGQGLSGNIDGLNGRVKRVDIGKYQIKNPVVAFPDSAGISGMFREEGRNGTLGNEILKRFHVVFDYAGNRCFLKSNNLFRDPFNYNGSGLEIEKPFYNIPVYQVYHVVPGSPADSAGLRPGDQIEMINFIRAPGIELDQINSILYGNEGRSVKLTIRRGDERIKTRIILDDRL